MKSIKFFIFFILTLLSSDFTFACTDFLIKNENQNVVVGRSMEFGINLESEIVIFPKGQSEVSQIFNRKKGLAWISKYTYLGITTFHTGLLADGMNEKGLSMGILWFPGAIYPKVNKKYPQSIIALEDLGRWILGSFADIEEVRNGLQNIQIWVHDIPQLKGTPPLHLSIHDKSGNSIAIEFLDGEMYIFDNRIGVLTNTPSFDWQATNLRNYINLTAINKASVKLDGTVLDPTGQGSGLLGIPGDWTPPSRFVKIAIIKNFAKKTKTADENKNLAFHLLNTVDIPYGVIESNDGKSFDYTQWAIVKDLSNLKFYYRTYNDLTIKTIDLRDEASKIGSKRKTIPMRGANI